MAKQIENVEATNNFGKDIVDIIRRATLATPVRVPIAKVDIDPKLNVREPDGSTYDADAMAEDLALNGQKEPVLLEKKKNGNFYVWRGFRRSTAIRKNAEKGIIDPTTGKPFDSVLAFVIEQELSEKERFAIMLDAGNTKTLTKVEVFYAVERGDKVYDTDAQLAISLRGALDERFPPKNPAELDTPEKYADYRRGLINNMTRAARSPVVLRDAYVEKIKGKQSWPLDKEVLNLHQLFTKEMKADKTRKISRLNPGPEFKKAWQAYVEKKLADVKAGKTPKKQGMMGRDDVDNAQTGCESRILKIVFDVVKREQSQDALVQIDALLVDVEAGKATAEQISAVLDSVTETAK